MSNLRQGVCVVLIDINNKCLMVTRPDGYGVGFPGGKLEADETFADAACRELWEETGLVVEPQDLIHLHQGVCSDHRPGGEHYDVVSFLAPAWAGQAVQKEDKIAPLWDKYEQLLTNSPFAQYNAAVLDALVSKFPSFSVLAPSPPSIKPF